MHFAGKSISRYYFKAEKKQCLKVNFAKSSFLELFLTRNYTTIKKPSFSWSDFVNNRKAWQQREKNLFFHTKNGWRHAKKYGQNLIWWNLTGHQQNDKMAKRELIGIAKKRNVYYTHSYTHTNEKWNCKRANEFSIFLPFLASHIL